MSSELAMVRHLFGSAVCDRSASTRSGDVTLHGLRLAFAACFTWQKKKEEVQAVKAVAEKREAALVAKGSVISDRLVRIYFLDGTYRSIYYDSRSGWELKPV